MISMTSTPVLYNSRRNPSVNEETAALDNEYTVVPGAENSEATLDTLIIRPGTIQIKVYYTKSNT